MRDLIKKIRNKRLKGNISLLVILILLASSVISLLSINQIQRLISYGNTTFNYFRSFYIAKAGTELGLAEVYLRGDGFNQTISSGNSIVQDNLVGAYTGFNPYFNMNITGSFQYITEDIRESNECSGGNMIKLNSGDLIMLSLFYDTTSGVVKTLSTGFYDKSYLTKSNIEDITLVNGEDYYTENKLTFAFFTYSGDSIGDDFSIIANNGTDDLYTFFSSFNGNLKNLLENNSIPKYLTIKNGGDETVEFCINMDNIPIPYSDSLITVMSNYGDVEVGIQSIVKKGVPDWAGNVSWE